MKARITGASCRKSNTTPQEYGRLYFVQSKPMTPNDGVGCKAVEMDATPEVAKKALEVFAKNGGKEFPAELDTDIKKFGAQVVPQICDLQPL